MRTTVNAVDLGRLWDYWDNQVIPGHHTPSDLQHYATTLASYQAAAPGVGGTLVEFFPGGWHPSRGTPAAFPAITQQELNIIANVANLNNNAALRNWMNAIPNLAAIPMN